MKGQRLAADDPRALAWRADLLVLNDRIRQRGLHIVVVEEMSNRLGPEHGYPVLTGTDQEILEAVRNDRTIVLVAASYFHIAAGWRQPENVGVLFTEGRVVAESLLSGTHGYEGLKVSGPSKLRDDIGWIKNGEVLQDSHDVETDTASPSVLSIETPGDAPKPAPVGTCPRSVQVARYLDTESDEPIETVRYEEIDVESGWFVESSTQGHLGQFSSLSDALSRTFVSDDLGDWTVDNSGDLIDRRSDLVSTLHHRCQLHGIVERELAAAFAASSLPSAVFDLNGPACFDGQTIVDLSLALARSPSEFKDNSRVVWEFHVPDGVESGGPMTSEYGEAVIENRGSYFYLPLGDSFDGYASFLGRFETDHDGVELGKSRSGYTEAERSELEGN